MVQYDRSPAMACDKFEPDLVLYHYGELLGEERVAIEAHLQTCEPCRLYLQGLESFLPLTLKQDEPPQIFWSDYSREMRQKLAEAREKRSWWRTLESFLQPWPVPAIVTAAVVALALTITLNKGLRRDQEVPSDEQALIEVLPVAENLEFFTNMDVLDAMDYLEQMGSSANGTT